MIRRAGGDIAVAPYGLGRQALADAYEFAMPRVVEDAYPLAGYYRTKDQEPCDHKSVCLPPRVTLDQRSDWPAPCRGWR